MKKVLLTISLALLLFSLAAEDYMYGAFQVKTKPSGADVTLYDPDLYLSPTPTPVYPVLMDEYMELVEGIPGRHIMLMITKKGYVPLRQEIFVPFTHEDEVEALEAPSVFLFELEKDVKKVYHKVSIYYGYRYRHPRPPAYVYYHPWFPPVHYGWSSPAPRPPRPPKPPKPPVVHSGSVTAGSTSAPTWGTASGDRDKTKPAPPNGPKLESKTQSPSPNQGSSSSTQKQSKQASTQVKKSSSPVAKESPKQEKSSKETTVKESKPAQKSANDAVKVQNSSSSTVGSSKDQGEKASPPKEEEKAKTKK